MISGSEARLLKNKVMKAGAMSLREKYFELEARTIDKLATLPYVHQFVHDKISGRITLFLLVVGTMALINELYITIEMTFLQKDTYEELNKGYIDESLKLHKMIVDDNYHSREYIDKKSGIVIEEFEDRDKFFAKPVHVAHLYAMCNVLNGEKRLLAKPLQFHIEFSPEDFEDEKRPEFGCRLRVLRTKLYHFFKDTELFHELVKDPKTFTVSQSVKIYNTSKEPLPCEIDEVQLCFLKIETGDTIECNFVI